MLSKAFSSFQDVSSLFFSIMRQIIRLVGCSVVQRFRETVVDRADYWKLFITMASGVSKAANWGINTCYRVMCSIVIGGSLMHRLLVTLGLHFLLRVVMLLSRLRWGWWSIYLFVPLLAVAKIWTAFWRLPSGLYLVIEVEVACSDSLSSLIVGSVLIGFFDTKAKP